MKVVIDSHSGFCAGVVRAISEAERALSEHGGVCCLGDIVHNRVEVQRLEALGLKTISHSDIEHLDTNSRMLIRAHGEPPTTYTLAAECGVEVIDATCPVVAALQRRVKRAYEQMERCNGQLVILGKRGHAEVVGLIGQVDGNAIVVESEADLESVDFSQLMIQSVDVYPLVRSTFALLHVTTTLSSSSAAVRAATAKYYIIYVLRRILTPIILRRHQSSN